MRLGLAHEIGFAIAMTSSFAIVLLGGELPAFAWLLLAAPWISLLLALKNVSPPGLSATLVGLAAVGLGVVTLVRGGVESSVLAGTEVLMGLLTARLLVRKTAAHDLQAVALSLLIVLAGSVLDVRLVYIGVFIVYSVTAIWALSTRQLLAGAAASARLRTDVVTPAFFGATAIVSLVVLASAALVFALFPRVGFGDIGAFLKKESRLPASVGLRGDPRLVGGNTVVARALDIPRDAFERGLYLRGAVYDVLSLEGFEQTKELDEHRGGMVELAEAPTTARYELTVMPVVGDTLLSFGTTVSAHAISGGNANPNVTMGVARPSVLDELKAYAPLASAMHYSVAGGIAAPAFVPAHPKHAPHPLSDIERARYLQLPGGFDDTLQKLDAGVVKDAPSARDKADALRAFFLSQFRYSQEPPRFATSPLRTFLLEDRQAHCEFFAAGYALLLRAAGVPARVVGGFQGGAWNDGVVVFAEKNAHAWVEWWDDDAGWIVDDATPLATAPREELTGVDSIIEAARRFWDDRVIDYSLQDQSDALSGARQALEGTHHKKLALAVIGASVVVVVAAVALWRRRRRSQAVRIDPLARALLAAAARANDNDSGSEHDSNRDRALTVRELVLRSRAKDDATVRAALALYEALRFGGQTATRDEVRRHVRALARVRASDKLLPPSPVPR